MGYASCLEHDVERRGQNRAAIEFEFQHPQTSIKRAVQTESSTERLRSADTFEPFMSREEVIAVREWCRRATQECNERLSREKVLLFKLNEQRQVLKVEYLTKGEAAEITGVGGGQLLDLDGLHDGVLSWFGYLFASDDLVEDGLQRYGTNVAPVALMNALIGEIKERRAA
jgi:hypothetical protein